MYCVLCAYHFYIQNQILSKERHKCRFQRNATHNTMAYTLCVQERDGWIESVSMFASERERENRQNVGIPFRSCNLLLSLLIATHSTYHNCPVILTTLNNWIFTNAKAMDTRCNVMCMWWCAHQMQYYTYMYMSDVREHIECIEP